VKRSEISRRNFLATTIGAASLALRPGKKPSEFRLSGDVFPRGNAPLPPIDRKSLIDRHSPSLYKLDPLSPLSVGNGEFAFSADITGLQTFPRAYENAMPLCTMSHWGWHTSALPSGLDPQEFRLTQYDTHGRQVGYQTGSEGQSELYKWLRENPHRLHLGMVGLRLLLSGGREAEASDISGVEQRLDLWTGILTSRFNVEGEPVTVKTAVHPDFDLLAVAIESTLIGAQRLAVRFAFPYGSTEMTAADWDKSSQHRSEIIRQTRNGTRIHRKLETDEYQVVIKWSGDASFTSEKAHAFLLKPGRLQNMLALVAEFSARRSPQLLPDAAAVFKASARHWAKFWSEGSAIELSESRDARAPELERRIVLSQYLTAIQCSGSMPPQETGLTVNSWYGKFHLEMHWWHAAHFALWNRLPLLEKSLGWYERILPGARQRAGSQGYRGARWPKMVGPEGRDSPSPIGPLLIWQQPHPIFYAELCYQTYRNRATLERYRSIVFESAEFMSSYAYFEKAQGRYVLGPPVIPAQENHPPRETWNPTFELAYWAYGLRVAQRWRERLGMKRKPEWDRVIANLSALPVRDGVYLAHENCPQTYTERNYDHPSMLGALGMLSGDRVDRETMRRTLKKVIKEWRWDTTWGWDYPLATMTAARLGETKLAVDALLMNTEKNRYLPNGHNWQRQNLPCYLPGNGGLLYAIALMAGGWQGSLPGRAPGFPADGSWTVKVENFNGSLLGKV
jgi:protein-glucosylgalactosylhydroxylysine glucosidase